MSTEWATLDSTADGWRLRFERRLKHPPEKVWRAITEPGELQHWFPARMEGERRAGASLRFVFDDAPMPVGEQSGEITGFEPPRLFEFEWNEDMLRFELRPDGDGCVLVFTHRLSEANGGRLAAARDAAGWDQCLAALEASLGGEQAAEQPMLPAIDAYVDRFGLGDGQVEDTADGRVLHFERDIVWQPPEQAWQVLVGSSGYLEPGAPVPASAAPAGGVVTHVEPPRVLEYAAGDGRVRWEFTADAKLGHRVSLTQVVPAQRTDAVPELLAGWKAHLEGFFARLMGG